MNPIKQAAAVAVVGTTLFGATATEAVEIRGASSCGAWVADRNTEANGWAVLVRRGWLLGYLSAHAVITGEDILKGTDTRSIDLWMDNYCRQNPLKRIDDGGDALFDELKRNKGR